jgi:hypothetical protein
LFTSPYQENSLDLKSGDLSLLDDTILCSQFALCGPPNLHFFLAGYELKNKSENKN